MYIDIVKHLEALDEKGTPTEIGIVEDSCQKYPDLRAYKDFLGVIRLTTPTANPFVDTMDITCRTDGGTIVVMPFVNDRGVHIYADPPQYIVGYTNPQGFGYVPLSDWETFLEDNLIAPEIIAKVRRLFGQHAPVNYADIP